MTGIALGVVMGVADTTLSMIIFAVIFALLLNYISSKASASRDTIISVFLQRVLLWDWPSYRKVAISANIPAFW